MSEAVKAASQGTATQLLSTPAPAAAAAAGSSASGSSTGSTILLQTPPPALSALNAGQIIRAVAAGRTADGKTLLDTRFGQLALRLPITPVRGQVMRLQITRGGAPVELSLLSLSDGNEEGNRPTEFERLKPGTELRGRSEPVTPRPTARPPGATQTPGRDFSSTSPAGAKPVAPGNAAPTGQPNTAPADSGKPAPVGPTGARPAGPGNFIPPAKDSAIAENTGRPAPASNTNPVRTSPGSATTTANADAVAASTGKILPAGYANAVQISAAESPDATPQHNASARPANSAPSSLNLRILSISMPGKAVPHSVPDDLVISGTVTGTARSNGTLVKTETGTLLLPGVSHAPKGAHITLQILGTPGTVLPLGAQAQSISAFSHGWLALDDAIEAVRAANPDRAGAIISNSVPTTGPRLTAGLALFLNAVLGVKIHDWLGRDLARALETQRRGDLLTRIADDFTEFSRLANEPIGNEWRTVMLPLMHDDVLHQIRLYLRAQNDEDGDGRQDGDDDAGTRFVVEVELSQLGALQLDGLVRPNRFDLMVRTHRDLPQHVRNEITVLFAAANEEMKASGQINFRVDREFPVAPLEQSSLHTVGVFA